MSGEKIIGIVGGVGPYAGADICMKIMDQTIASKDQEHLSVALLSAPDIIEDRTAYLLGNSNKNPALAIIDIIKKLEHIGAGVIGIPCNATHSPQIFNTIKQSLKNNRNIKLLNMIEEVGEYLEKCSPRLKNIGVLSATGTYKSNIYKHVLEAKGFKVIVPDEDIQNQIVHNSIYNPKFGIKAKSRPISEKARKLLLEAIQHLKVEGAEAVILGCTEIPLAIKEKTIDGVSIIDSSLVLARALVREAAFHKLRPIELESFDIK